MKGGNQKAWCGEKKGKELVMMLFILTGTGVRQLLFSSHFGEGQSLFFLKMLFAATDLLQKKRKVSKSGRGKLCRHNSCLDSFPP